MAPLSATRVDWSHMGFSQLPGFKYLEVFAPTVHLPTLCIILELTAIHDLHLWSVDVSNAYLNGEMDCDVYDKGLGLRKRTSHLVGRLRELLGARTGVHNE